MSLSFTEQKRVERTHAIETALLALPKTGTRAVQQLSQFLPAGEAEIWATALASGCTPLLRDYISAARGLANAGRRSEGL